MGALKLLYFDCFSGASGDMILGALIDAGVTLDDLRGALGKLAIHADIMWTETVVRAGIRATKFQVGGEPGPADEDHDRHHRHHELASAAVHRHASESSARHQADSHPHASEGSYRPDSGSHPHAAVPLPHRTVAEIFHLIDASGLSGPSKDRAKHLFTVLGEAEAAIHGTSLDRVHLHEVGALDSIIDIVGTVFALERLGVDRIHSSPLNVGGGTIRSAHGRYPVPAPATMRLLKGVPVYAGPESVELVTPTGALLVAGYATEFGALPPMRVERIGYGAGARDLPHSPNVLRVLIGESDAAAPSQSVVVIEAEIDDMNPQLFGAVMDRLLAEGALDVFYTPIQMKKNRPGTLMTVIAKPVERERLTATIFRETTTIGVRYREMARDCLERDVVTVDTAVGPVRVKVARRDGRVFNVSPEFDDCVRLAQQHGRPVKEIQALAATAFLSR